jgi:hypothetical protein
MMHVLMQAGGGGGGGGGAGGGAGAGGAIVGLLFFFVIVGVMVAIWGTIFKKAGYSFWLGLLMIVPLANLIWLLIFAFSTWPIHRELERYRAQIGYAGGGFPVGAAQPQMAAPPMPPPPPPR